MKNLLPLLLWLFTLPLVAQLEVVPDRVAIGRSPLLDATFEAANYTHKKYGAYITSRLTNVSDHYALWVENYKPRNNGYGAAIYQYDNSSSLGYNVTGLLIDNNMWGTGANTGLFVNLRGYGGGEKKASWAYVADNYGSAAAGSVLPIYGHDVYLVNKYRAQATAFNAEVYADGPNAQRFMYGYRFTKTGNTAGTTYGVYSDVPTTHGEAGYFDGNVVVTGTLTEMSDATLKTDVVDLTEASDLLRALRPRRYRFLDDAGLNLASDGESLGFLAQEVEEVLPELVVDVRIPAKYGTPADWRPDPSDTTGAAPPRELLHPATTKKGIRYTELIPLLVRAFQEQAELLDALPDVELLRSSAGVSAEKLRALAAENQALRAEVTGLRAELTDLAAAVAELRNCTDCYGDRRKESLVPTVGQSTVYPNPARGQLTVRTTPGAYVLVVRDAAGKERYRGGFDVPVVTLDVADWAAGLYVVEIVREGVVVEGLKVTVVR